MSRDEKPYWLDEIKAQRDELLDSLKSMTRLVEALSYTHSLGHGQRERFNKAKAIISKIKVTGT